jgi:cellobiose-specific phosphotransferase system component IIB
MEENNTYWIVEKSGEKANLSVCSEAEAEAMQSMDDFEDWMIAPTQQFSKDDMEERIEEHGMEFDPWA